MEGKVKFYDKRKAFGFITGLDGKDYFFHKSQLTKDIIPKEGQAVNFKPAKNEKGLQAQDIEFFKKK